MKVRIMFVENGGRCGCVVNVSFVLLSERLMEDGLYTSIRWAMHLHV